MIAELRRLVGEDAVLAGSAAERAYDCDAYTVERNPPVAIVLPSDTPQVAEIIRWCVANGVPFTPRGAGTGLSGGVLPALGGVVISTKRLTRILDINADNRLIRVQTGIANQRVSNAVRGLGLHFAPDPSSQTVSTIGGNIAENAGGPHTLKYGVTAPHVVSLTLVDPVGEVRELGGVTEGGPGYDFRGLVIGAEGTLGMVTEATLRLTPLPAHSATCLIAFASVREATQAVARVVGAGITPAALEMVDQGIMGALRAAFNLAYPEGAQALLLVECDGGEAARVSAEMAAVTQIARELGALDIRIAADERERADLWVARKKGVGAMGRLAPSVVTHDGVIPRSKLPEMLDFVYQTADQHGVRVANIFHAGDGNLHPCFYFDDRDPAQVEAVVAAGEAIIQRCLDLGGSITGEHGIGVEKLDLMARMFTPDDLRVQAMAKSILNPGHLCNLCKVLPNQKSCVEHRKRWRGAAT